MRSLVVVTVWGVTAVLLLSGLGDALGDVEEVEAPPASSDSDALVGAEALPVPENDRNASAPFQLTLDDFPAQDDALLEEELYEDEHSLLEEKFYDDAEYYPGDEELSGDETTLSLDERRKRGNAREERGRGRGCKNHAEHSKSSKHKNSVEVKDKRRQGQRRKPNTKGPTSGKKAKGKKIKLKSKKNRVVERKDRVRIANSGNGNTRPRTKDGSSKVDERRKPETKRCTTKKACSSTGGKCKSKCNGPQTTGKCKGKHCFCCAKKPKPCKQKGTCVGNGTCRRICLASETESNTFTCKGKKCKCCVQQASSVCEADPSCTDLGGTCKATKCGADKFVPGLCKGKGPNCNCCVKRISCPATSTCPHTCRQFCEPDEEKKPDKCNGQHCQCCGPPSTVCTQTPTCPGTCSRMCDGVVSLEDHCLNEGCICCLDCSPKQECIDANGVCRSLCGCGEKELKDGCNGDGCKCCVADILECNDSSSSCSNCLYTPMCTVDPPKHSCGSQKGCSCCSP